MRRLQRLSVRIRVTLALTAVMAVVLAATGLFVYLRLASELDATVDQGLRARAGDLSALVGNRQVSMTPVGRSLLTEEGENLAQVLSSSGRVVDSTPTLRGAPFLTSGELARALRRTTRLYGKRVPGEGDRVRVLATPVRVGGSTSVVVVGAPLEDRRDALRSLAGLLLIGGPIALLLAALAGYAATAAALRPVERMRRRASEIQAARPSERLPVPPADDEIGRLGHTLNALLARLEETLERERTFVSDASHELRTPLAIVKAEIELALRDGATGEEHRAALASVGEETDRLIQLAEDLLVIARSDQGRLPIRAERVLVIELFEDVRRRFERRAAAAGVAITATAVVDLTVEGDPLRVEQALGNLVDNALRHGGSTVELRGEVTATGVELHVVDDGAGFPPGFVGSAFERFTRADSARERGGSGLGLAIVRAIAEAHSGTARAGGRADGGSGASVTLLLPRR